MHTSLTLALAYTLFSKTQIMSYLVNLFFGIALSLSRLGHGNVLMLLESSFFSNPVENRIIDLYLWPPTVIAAFQTFYSENVLVVLWIYHQVLQHYLSRIIPSLCLSLVFSCPNLAHFLHCKCFWCLLFSQPVPNSIFDLYRWLPNSQRCLVSSFYSQCLLPPLSAG